jgi:hypothetical protein
LVGTQKNKCCCIGSSSQVIVKTGLSLLTLNVRHYETTNPLGG